MEFPRSSFVLYLLLLSATALAKTVTYDWEVTFVHNANPDGRHSRTVVGINGQWPCPKIEVEVGDRLVVNVLNKLPNQYTSLHFHGLHQRGSAAMDGPPSATQCQIPPGGIFTYDFEVGIRRASLCSNLLIISDQTARDILVSFSYGRPVRRWITWPSYNKGSQITVQKRLPQRAGTLRD